MTSDREIQNDRLLAAGAKRNWFIFRRDFVASGLMTKLQALFYQELVNFSQKPRMIWDKDKFFLCTLRYLYKSMRWGFSQQGDMLRALSKKGFVETKTIDKQRWVKVWAINVQEALEKTHYGKRSAMKSVMRRYETRNGNRSEEIHKQKKDKKHCCPTGNGALNGFHANGHSFGYKLAEWFGNELLRQKKCWRMPSVKTWGKQFDELVQDISRREKVTVPLSKQYLKTLIKDHAAHLSDRYQPKLLSAKSIREDFARLERIGRVKLVWEEREEEVDTGDNTCVLKTVRSPKVVREESDEG